MDQPGESPTIARLRLGALLRAHRTTAGITGTAAAARIGGSSSKISRIESGLLPVREADTARLLDLYGVTGPAEREALMSLSRDSERAEMWDDFRGDLPAHVLHALKVEAAAVLIICYDPVAVPALLQTPDYARAATLRGMAPHSSRGGLRADMLALRRQLLLRPEPPRLWILIDESVLNRPPDGNPATMGAQIANLIELAGESHITVQVIPSDTADTATAGGPFTILRLPVHDLPDVVLIEQLTTITTLERLREVDRYLDLLYRLAIGALSPGLSLEFLRETAERLDGG